MADQLRYDRPVFFFLHETEIDQIDKALGIVSYRLWLLVNDTVHESWHAVLNKGWLQACHHV